jgi:regulator of protease activity HflC (stomatin/prohibitin superfamily)
MASIKLGQKGQKPPAFVGVAIFIAVLLIMGADKIGPIIKNTNISFMEILFWVVIGLAVFIILSGLRVVDQYEKGIMLTLGKYTGTRGAGLTWIFWPFYVQRMFKIDMRVKAVDVPDQNAITKDNISVGVNAVIYYKVSDAAKAFLNVEDYFGAISQLAQTTMRNVVGEVELDQLLAERARVSDIIREIVDKRSDEWGISVSDVEFKDISLPKDMERTIAKQAEAERERRAVIIKAEGEVAAADNMSKAAKILATTPGALHLRTLQSINDISSDQSNTIVFAVPLEILRAFESYNDSKK